MWKQEMHTEFWWVNMLKLTHLVDRLKNGKIK